MSPRTLGRPRTSAAFGACACELCGRGPSVLGACIHMNIAKFDGSVKSSKSPFISRRRNSSFLSYDDLVPLCVVDTAVGHLTPSGARSRRFEWSVPPRRRYRPSPRAHERRGDSRTTIARSKALDALSTALHPQSAISGRLKWQKAILRLRRAAKHLIRRSSRWRPTSRRRPGIAPGTGCPGHQVVPRAPGHISRPKIVVSVMRFPDHKTGNR